jgi:hypothetical protein
LTFRVSGLVKLICFDPSVNQHGFNEEPIDGDKPVKVHFFYAEFKWKAFNRIRQQLLLERCLWDLHLTDASLPSLLGAFYSGYSIL